MQFSITYNLFLHLYIHSKNEDHGIYSHHLWQIDGETMGTVTGFIFLGSKITVDGDCSHEIKRCSFLGRKVMANLDSILKTRDITLMTKFRIWMYMDIMYGCESWTIKTAEH